jgi:hypothetical protein
MIPLHQTVRVTRDIPEQRVTRGMVGAVIMVFDAPKRAYEIEFVDSEGRTVLQSTLTEDSLEAV